ncbi:glycosyltransferase 36 [Melioribacter roseus P3M-2]|uniref:Glycosyltransferase 36 n=1 Tax=Melioribacter roseus (strain DSM 23840 / JCM 17771 / VKM B-2668 / P3M-2) TaxID=1191523 RepID=I6YW43_MELRP|nr:glycosyltransferase 36 [Melioribacter roseus]AFN74812.1 glycosyltransferase 36 [Melioribacter roseus P3M-2]
MNYGHFSEDGKEYIITNVKTPTPWINYIYNGEYFSTVSNNAGGISYIKSPLHGRITRYRINDVPSDRPGKYIYVKDEETGKFWTLSWQPAGADPGAYKVIHGLGYTAIESLVDGIHARVTYFVPMNNNHEVWNVVLTNKSGRKRRLSITGYVEFALGHGLIDLINQCDDQHFNRAYFDKNLNALFATKTYWVTETNGTQHQENKEWNQWAFFTSNLRINRYETLRERFLGFYNSEEKPVAITEDKFSNSAADYGNVVGAINVNLELESDQRENVIFSLGVLPKEHFDDKKKDIPKIVQPEYIEFSFKEIVNYWSEFLGHTKVETPDRNVNIFMNNWVPYQAKVAFDVGRVASYYYWGISRGYGFRDTSQDVIAVTIAHPEKAKERILLLSRQMFSDGRVYHHFYDDGKGELTRHCDDPGWYILAVTEYIKETGDYSILKEKVSFVDRQEGTVLDHLLAVVNFMKNNLGRHSLPVFGRGDWNDTLDYIGGDDGGESVWGAMFYVAMLNKLIELFQFLKVENLTEILKLRDEIRRNINQLCWDGDWFIRAFGNGGMVIGSNKSKEGKIFVNTQSWAAISNLPDKSKIRRALDSVKKHLDSEYGPKICAPAFKEIDPNIGLVTRCVPGKKENGAVFCHPVTWLIQAECIMRNGERAYDYFSKLLPNRVDSDIYQAEPYVYSQYITSDEHASPGKASHSWQTGTAAWMYRVFYDYIVGIRPDYDGLIVDPVIPTSWNYIRIERIFRGAKYIIEVENPDKVQSGISYILVDGKEIEGNKLPLTDKKICHVKVLMGKTIETANK